MELEAQTRVFIEQVKQAVRAQEKAAAEKSGLFSRLFSKKPQTVEEGDEVAGEGEPAFLLMGLKVRGERDYTLGRLRGAGASGVVFEATDPAGATVAVKIIQKPLKKDDAADALFRREIEIGRTVEHPAVVKTLDAFEIEPARFVVMEMVDGVTLKERLQGPLEPAEFVRLFEPISLGLQAAHERGVVHRDLKPENVMVTSDGEVKVLDFGMARVEQDVSVTATGTFKGTLHYTSPEQITDSKRVGPASDQFAFGLMCFEALTGDFAFLVNTKKPMEAIMGRIECNPKTLMEVKPELGEAASRVISKMLSLQPEDRYPSVREGFEALTAALDT